MIPGLNQYTAQKMAVANFIKNRAGWLIWAAGFSVINILMEMGGTDWHFMIGLGSADVLFVLGNHFLPSQLGGFFLSLVPTLIFVCLGFQAGKRHTWAFYSAMALYTLDALLLLRFQDFLSAAFHGYVLFRLYEGLARINDYNELDAAEARMLRHVMAPGETIPQPAQNDGTWPPAPAMPVNTPNLGWAGQSAPVPQTPWAQPAPGALPVDWARRLDPVPLPVSQPGDWANQPGGVIPPAQTAPSADWASIPGGPTQPSLPQSGTQKWPPATS